MTGQGLPVVVVGAGVVGLATALRLAERGERVVVVDSAAPGQGTSGTSFSWLNAHGKAPRAYHDLNRAGLAAYRRLADETGDTLWLRLTGRIEWADTARSVADLDAAATKMRDWGYPVEPMTVRQALGLEPDLRIPRQAEIRFWPDEGYVVPERFIGHLVERAKHAGVALATGQAVVGFDMVGNVVRGVVLADGAAIGGKAVVSCVGRWTQDLVGRAGAHVPMIPPVRGGSSLGLLGYTGPVKARLARVVSTPRLNVRPDAQPGRFVLQATDLDPSVDAVGVNDSDGDEARELLRRGFDVLERFAGARLDSLRTGYRSIPADRITVAGWVPGAAGLYVLATHSGYTLAPILGELATREIADGADEPMLNAFPPARFAALPPVGE